MSDNGAVELYHNNVKKVETNANAVNIINSANSWSTISRASNGYFGFAFNEGSTTYAYLGITGGGSEIGQYVPAGNALVLRTQSNFHLYSGYNTRLLTTNTNNAVELYYGGGKKFETYNDGCNFLGHVTPNSNNTYDLGTSTYRWRNLYTHDLNLSNEGSKNDVDGTWGNYTIQEGESDLFLINKRSGKKYKFNLTEVS